MEAVTPTAAKRRVRLSVEAPGRLGVLGDPAALGRVFRNLLANAVRHSPEDGEVRIELADVGLRVETVVIDQGGGFTHPLQAFVPFIRTDTSRNRDSGGSGLGLAIAKGIIEAHGGTIRIDEGPGGRVRFALPSH